MSMKKKLLSLALALALCLGLTVPALAVNRASFRLSDGDGNTWVEPSAENTSGNGWTYDPNPGGIPVLTLNGLHSKEGTISIEDSMIIELAPGSKSTLASLDFSRSKGAIPSVTIQGSGELILDFTVYQMNAFDGYFSELKFADNLTVTGGRNQGAASPLTLSQPDQYGFSFLTDGKESAFYVRIGPAASAVPETPAASGFTDVAADSPYAEAVQWAVGQKITSGKTAVTFGPGDTCTVSHILTFLWRASDRPGDKGDERAAVAAWAQGLGIDTGNLSAPCTRSMAVLYMWKAAGSPAPAKTASFADVPSGADYASAVSWAVEKGITNGTGGDTFSPGGTCTRGQIVTFLYRASK